MNYAETQACSKCKRRLAEVDLMWVQVKGKMKLMCCNCKEGK